MKKFDKTADEVLKQKYMSAYDLQIVIPYLSYQKALNYIENFRAEMEEKKYFVPDGKTKVALTRLITKKLGI
jgi:hypothetical protein